MSLTIGTDHDVEQKRCRGGGIGSAARRQHAGNRDVVRLRWLHMKVRTILRSLVLLGALALVA
ncbi:MAG: hypothetical protein WCA93_09890, partial [Acidimicrobiia bacterium]